MRTYSSPVLVHEVSYRARQFVISGVFYRWREHGVFLQMRHFPSFRCWSRLRWSSALHSSFVPVEFLLPPERTVTYCAHEWFGPTATRVSLQGESARENASACRTFMHRDRCCCGCCCFVPICPLGGSTVVQVGRWRHCRKYPECTSRNWHLRCGHEPRQTCF